MWVDISSLAFVYPTPELARILRTHLTFAPEKVLFGTVAGGNPGVPGGECTTFCSRARPDGRWKCVVDTWNGNPRVHVFDV